MSRKDTSIFSLWVVKRFKIIKEIKLSLETRQSIRMQINKIKIQYSLQCNVLLYNEK